MRGLQRRATKLIKCINDLQDGKKIAELKKALVGNGSAKAFKLCGVSSEVTSDGLPVIQIQLQQNQSPTAGTVAETPYFWGEAEHLAFV